MGSATSFASITLVGIGVADGVGAMVWVGDGETSAISEGGVPLNTPETSKITNVSTTNAPAATGTNLGKFPRVVLTDWNGLLPFSLVFWRDGLAGGFSSFFSSIKPSVTGA